MPETFYPPPRVSDPDTHHGMCVTHVPWCMLGSLTNCFYWSMWWGKRSRHFRRMRNPQFYLSVRGPCARNVRAADSFEMLRFVFLLKCFCPILQRMKYRTCINRERLQIKSDLFSSHESGIILCMHPANEKRIYNVKGAYKNDPWWMCFHAAQPPFLLAEKEILQAKRGNKNLNCQMTAKHIWTWTSNTIIVLCGHSYQSISYQTKYTFNFYCGRACPNIA